MPLVCRGTLRQGSLPRLRPIKSVCVWWWWWCSDLTMGIVGEAICCFLSDFPPNHNRINRRGHIHIPAKKVTNCLVSVCLHVCALMYVYVCVGSMKDMMKAELLHSQISGIHWHDSHSFSCISDACSIPSK